MAKVWAKQLGIFLLPGSWSSSHSNTNHHPSEWHLKTNKSRKTCWPHHSMKNWKIQGQMISQSILKLEEDPQYSMWNCMLKPIQYSSTHSNLDCRIPVFRNWVRNHFPRILALVQFISPSFTGMMKDEASRYIPLPRNTCRHWGHFFGWACQVIHGFSCVMMQLRFKRGQDTQIYVKKNMMENGERANIDARPYWFFMTFHYLFINSVDLIVATSPKSHKNLPKPETVASGFIPPCL